MADGFACNWNVPAPLCPADVVTCEMLRTLPLLLLIRPIPPQVVAAPGDLIGKETWAFRDLGDQPIQISSGTLRISSKLSETLTTYGCRTFDRMLFTVSRIVFTLIGCGLIGIGVFWAFIIDPALFSHECGRPCSVFRSNALIFGQSGGALVTGLLFGLVGSFVLWSTWAPIRQESSRKAKRT